MSDTCCPFIKPDGEPCAARPLPNSDFCLFHDPGHQQALTESRSKGGSTPRPRTRRFPRLLDHVHVAELLGELFIDALNDPEAIDTHRLQALTALSRVLLKAVGTPPTFLVHSDRREPHPAAGLLLRVYPPLPPEVEALLAAEPPAHADTQPPPPAGQPAPAIREAPANQLARVGAPPAPALAADGAVSPEPLNARTPEPPNTEQALNRSGTGLPGTNPSPPGEPVLADQTMVAASP